MATEEINQVILEFIQERYLSRIPDETGLTAETLLFEQGIVDSIGVLMLVQFVEEHFSIQVEPEEMVLDNFASVSCMSRLVLSKQGVA